MKKFISIFLLAIFGLAILGWAATPVNAAVQPTSNIIPEGIYYIRNQRSGLYLDVYKEGKENNTKLHQYYYTGGDNQRFRLKYISSDVYEIIPLHTTGMSLDIYDASPDNYAHVNIFTSHSGVAQRFKIVSTGNGDNSFKILTCASGYTKCITTLNASMDPADIIQHTYANDGNQDNDHWYFEDVTLNEKILVTLSAGQTKSFEITIPDNMYYVVETTQYGSSTVDTYLTVSNLSTGNAYDDDDGGVGSYSFIGFNNQGGRDLTISVKLRNSSASGSFYLQIRKQKAVYYGFKYNNLNTISDLNKPYEAFSDLYYSCRYEDMETSHFQEIDERGYSRYNSEIVFFSGHGYGGNEVSFKNSTFYLSNLNNMSNVRIAVWSACYSSKTDNYDNTSLVDKSVANGAKSALGFPDSVDDVSARSFTNNLFKKLSEGYSIGDAASYAANRLILPSDTVKNYRIAGSSSTTLTTPNYAKSALTLPQKSIQENYYKLISNNEYMTFDNGDTIRYYLTINGIMSDQFVDVAKKGKSQVSVTQNYNVSGDITVLPTLYKYDMTDTSTEEKHLVYIVRNNVATPVLITHVMITEEDGATYLKTFCRNLNNNEYINYEDICTVKED